MELLQGADPSLKFAKSSSLSANSNSESCPFPKAIGDTAAALIEQHALAHGIQLADALIAATALESGDTFCTGKAKYFRPISGLSRVAFRP
jgi:predicted nucleic acid-binding protein